MCSAIYPDAPFVDEVKIETVPRYKTSDLSGDEWRYLYRVTLWRKGILVEQRECSTMECAAAAVPSMVINPDFFTRIKFTDEHPELRLLCDNLGCKNKAEATYRLKTHRCDKCGERGPEDFQQTVAFCNVHRQRGNCGILDADSNYTLVSGPAAPFKEGEVNPAAESFESPSGFGGAVTMD